MSLPSGFQFSQGSLQDYVDCPRLFQLRYVRRLRWPAMETDRALENERHLRRGATFHRLIRQHLMGMPAEALSRTMTKPDLRRWWHNYLEKGPPELPPRRYPEVRLGTSIGPYHLVAQYDLIAMGPGHGVTIVDWKTSRRRPRKSWLSERTQTRVYPYVLVQAGDALESGTTVEPDDVSMIYWFANFPSAPAAFRYNDAQFRADGRYLLDLVSRAEESIGMCGDGDLLPGAEDWRRCGICRYRSLCERGVEPGRSDEDEPETAFAQPFDLSLEFEQIAELDLR